MGRGLGRRHSRRACKRGCGRLRPACLAGALRRAHDRARDLVDRVLAETGRGAQLLSAVLGPGEHRGGLRARPFERLLDFGTGGVRELGGLMARLLEQAAALGLRLLELAGRVGVSLGEQLARLVAGGVQHLGPLPLALLAIPLDLGLALLELVLAAADLFLGLRKLRAGCVLCVALDRVGELGGGADQVQRVHADGMAGRLDRRAGAGTGGLEHAQLGLQLGRMAAERIEGVADSCRVEAVPDLGNVLIARQRRQRRDPCAARTFGSHLVVPLVLNCVDAASRCQKYDFFIGCPFPRLDRDRRSSGFRALGAPCPASRSEPR